MQIAKEGNVTIKITPSDNEGSLWNVHPNIDPGIYDTFSDDRKRLIKGLTLDESEFPGSRTEAENQAEAIVTLKRNLEELDPHLTVDKIQIEPESEVAFKLKNDWGIRDIGEMRKGGEKKD